MTNSTLPKDKHTLDALHAVVLARKGADPASSYTAKLFSRGRLKIAQKIGEEGVETALAAVAEGKPEVVSESADLLYHLTVLWADMGIDPADIWAELDRRFGTSGLDEKKARKKS